jgi:hypothetical protein
VVILYQKLVAKELHVLSSDEPTSFTVAERSSS